MDSLTAELSVRPRLPNDVPLANPSGWAATHSTAGSVDLTTAFHRPLGSNGRRCATCHVPEDGWSIGPHTIQRLFDETGGRHPLFNLLDADRPGADVSTVAARRRSYSMLLQGKFVRLRTPPPGRQFEVIAAADPLGVGSTTQLLFFRRPLPTANLRGQTVMWDGAHTVGADLPAGLAGQAQATITGALGGAPASEGVIASLLGFELGLSHAQLIAARVGRLDCEGARGGPRFHAEQPPVIGRFDLFDAWIDHRDPRRARIARGQELFNNENPGSLRACNHCHSGANDGQNLAGFLFDVGTSAPSRRKPDMAVYTLRRTLTGEIRQTTDWGRAGVTGFWVDLDRFKPPSLRGLAARAPYFHNGIAGSLREVVAHYQQALGFVFTEAEAADLVAFLEAL